MKTFFRTRYLTGLVIACTLSAAGAAAQTYRFTREEWKDPDIYSAGTAPLRTEFFSFDTRERAEKNNPADSPFYLPLDIRTDNAVRSGKPGHSSVTVDIPYMWLDREVFLHARLDAEAYYVKINDRTIGYVRDNATPAEFNISPWIVDGENTITFEFLASDEIGATGFQNAGIEENVFIYSQPKLRIEDYSVTTRIDSSGTHCILRTELALANSYNSRESFRVGYDIYRPDGKLIHYDLKDVTLPGNSRDTVVFEQPIYDKVMGNLWSAESPKLYDMILNINYDQRWIEYLPVKVGFGETAFRDGKVYRNGKPVDIKAVSYVKADKALTPAHLKALKKAGYNTIWPVVPQPIWFYDMCEAAGMYVIESANIYSPEDRATTDRNVGGTLRNDPAWLGSFMGRAKAMHTRVKDRPGIIGWSIGGETGNGYNMYKVYQWVKSQDSTRPVIFNYAEGEWNNDMSVPVEEGEPILRKLGQKVPGDSSGTDL